MLLRLPPPARTGGDIVFGSVVVCVVVCVIPCEHTNF